MGVPLPESRFMPTLHRKKSWGHTAATCKEHSDQNQTHTSLSECLFNENRSKTFSKNIKGGSGEDDEAEYESEKGKSENEVPLSGGSLSPKPNIMYIAVISLHRKHHISTPNFPHYECFLILITSDEKRAKATSHQDRIHRRSALQGTAKAQGYALCLPPEAHRATKNISTIASPTSRDCRAKAAATAP